MSHPVFNTNTNLGKAALVAGGLAFGVGVTAAVYSFMKSSDGAKLKATTDELRAAEEKLQAVNAQLAKASGQLQAGTSAAAASAAPTDLASPVNRPPSTPASGSETRATVPVAATSSAAAASGAASATGSEKRKPTRIYMDGVFDLMHYGHSNALRQARKCGDVLVVGLVNDAEVIKNKGSPPVMPEEERYIALSACKWVDEVIRDAPYDLTEDWVTTLVEKHQIDYIVHGDDPCITADGKDAYAYAKRIGKYKQIKRTEGVSTTDIVGRMLLMSRDHHVPEHTHDGSSSSSSDSGSGGGAGGGSASEGGITSGDVIKRSVRSSSLGSLKDAEDGDVAHLGTGNNAQAGGATSAAGGAGASSATTPASSTTGASGGSNASAIIPAMPTVHSKFLPTARRIMQFAEGRVPEPGDKVVYMCGGFDLFNAGHIGALKAARDHGDFLLVGIHDDTTVNALRGHGLPILNLYERALSLLSCKWVDEVIIGAPWAITEEMIKSMNISVVVKGKVSDTQNERGHVHMGWTYDAAKAEAAMAESYAVPERMGIVRTIDSPKGLTALDIIDRILASQSVFAARYERKSKMEDAYVKQKTYVQEQ